MWDRSGVFFPCILILTLSFLFYGCHGWPCIRQGVFQFSLFLRRHSLGGAFIRGDQVKQVHVQDAGGQVEGSHGGFRGDGRL